MRKGGANYREEDVPEYRLPDPLTAADGTRISDADAWVRVRRPEVLNLFGYTGLASLACAKSGAKVTHVDASRKAIGFARENAAAAGLWRPAAGSGWTSIESSF